MSLSTGMQGLSLDQAPPLSIPMSFFVTAPLALVAAGLVLLAGGTSALGDPALPATIGLAHLGTLGFLGMIMMGALYQMTPVVAVAAVPMIRLAHLVHGLMIAGVTTLMLWSQGLLPMGAAPIAFGSLVAGMSIFAVSVGSALWRSTTQSPTVRGMRLALASLTSVIVLGYLMSRGWSGGGFPGDRALFIQGHFSVAILGWVGGLIAAVGWQVLPMFYMTPEFPIRQTRMVQSAIGASVVMLLAILVLCGRGVIGTGGSAMAAIAALPAALAVWFWHPKLMLGAIANRRRKRRDPSLRFWRAGMWLAPITGLSAGLAFCSTSPVLDLLFGWLAIFGWAGLVVHGMLTRIVPFIIWFHWFSPLVGIEPVPATSRLIDERLIKGSFYLHLVALVLGAFGIVSQSDFLLRVTGGALVGLGVCWLSAAWQLRAKRRGDLTS